MDDPALPLDVSQALGAFVASAREALGDQLVSLVLFGSAAEGRLRPTSDVNVMLILGRFDRARIDALREPLRLAHATIRLEAMIVLESELHAASEAFAVKFADIKGHHRVLAGSDLLSGITPSRVATLHRVRQILLNYVIRTRERYVLQSLREEQLAGIVADSAGPLRAASEIILQLEGRPAASPKAALEALAHELDAEGWVTPLAHMSRAREELTLPAGTGGATLISLIELAQALYDRAATLRG
jgi:predicted nucleotidyltransferase